MTKEEGNKLIGEFMSISGRDPGTFIVNGFLIVTTQLLYHTSWDWLMPVVLKIRDLKTDFTKKKQLMQSVARLEFDNIYSDTIQFIQWYNQNKQQ